MGVAYTALIRNESTEIPVKSDGSFSKTMSIRHPMDLYLYLNNDAITIFVQPGDTLNIDWDEKNFKETFKITANQPGRQTELDVMMDLYNQYRGPMNKLNQTIYSNALSDSAKFDHMKTLFLGQMKLLTDRPFTQNSKKILYDIYCRHATNLSRLNRTARTDLKLPLNLAIPDDKKQLLGGTEFFDLRSWGHIDRLLDENVFLASYEYRNYIETRMQNQDMFSAVSYSGGPRPNRQNNYTLINCYNALGKLGLSPLIRDWYLTKTIIDGFSFYNFMDVEDAYKKISPEVNDPVLKKELVSYYNSVQNLKPGKAAPVFNLKDINGKMVSLNDFKGKVVYIDFWGVSCGPCIGDIKTYGAKFHDKYKAKGVVFLNICVDSGDAEWRKSVADLKLDGINLMATSMEDPAIKAYHLNSIPHYIIVDADGNIVNSNAPRMGDLFGNGVDIKRDKKGNNELDIAIASAQ